MTAGETRKRTKDNVENVRKASLILLRGIIMNYKEIRETIENMANIISRT